jgi:hypothetical protein
VADVGRSKIVPCQESIPCLPAGGLVTIVTEVSMEVKRPWQISRLVMMG